MNRARVLITTECNLKCPYCCNKLKNIQESIKFITYDEFVGCNYDEVNISGGEPMIELDKLKRLLPKIKGKKYLYTNGHRYYRAFEVADQLDGVNIGYHTNFDKTLHAALHWKKFVKNVRFHAESGKLTKKQKKLLDKSNIDVVEWIKDDCDKSKEDRWII